jgi:transposase-like protein
VLPLLYLHGLSTSDFGPALEQFLGSGAGLSATTITRLTAQWQDEAKTFAGRDLSGTDYVYLWVDGIVRHAALCDRAGVQDPRRPVVVATG